MLCKHLNDFTSPTISVTEPAMHERISLITKMQCNEVNRNSNKNIKFKKVRTNFQNSNGKLFHSKLGKSWAKIRIMKALFYCSFSCIISTSTGISIYIQLTLKISQMTNFTTFFLQIRKYCVICAKGMEKLMSLCNVIPEYCLSISRKSFSVFFCEILLFHFNLRRLHLYIATYFRMPDKFVAYFRP